MATRVKTNSEPTSGEKRFVQAALLGGEEPLWMQWVTKRKRDKVQDRLLVVGIYRVFSIKRTVTGKKVVKRVGHFFDLKELFSSDTDRIVFKFKDFDIDIQAPGAGTDLIYQLRCNWQKFTTSFADYALPKITLLPPDRQLQALPSIDPGPCNGFIATYIAYCNYYRIVPSQEFTKFITDIQSSGSTDLVLDECPGIERKENPINFVPIKAALRHNTYFTSFTCKNIPRREVAECLGDTLLHNITLKKLVLSGIDAREEGFVAIGNALKRNQHNILVDFDFSNNPMRDRGAAAIAEGLQFLTHTIFRLNMANCGLSSKGISSLLQAFCFGKEVARNITELDLSHNNVGSQGSSQLANYFNQATVNCQLQILLLSNTKVEAPLVFRSMKNATIRSITELDVSGNKLDVQGAQALSTVIDTLPGLKALNLAFCDLNSPSIEGILRSVTNNQNLTDVSVNISGNEIGPQGAHAIAQVLQSSNTLTSLIARGCGFKKEGLTKIVDALGTNTRLQVLDLSLNFASGTSAKMVRLINALADNVKKHPSLQYLGLAGDANKKIIGKEIEPLLKAMSANPLITELDITGNKIGDPLAVVLCDNLRTNSNLKALLWDKNEVNIGGFRALLTLMSANKSLACIPNPRFDIDKAVKEAKNKDQFKEKAKEVLDQIRDILKTNAGGQPYVLLPKTKQGKTYGENYKQFIGLGVAGTSQDPSAANYPIVSPSSSYDAPPSDYTRFGTISNGSDSNYYSSPPQEHQRFGTLSSPPSSMMIPGNVGTMNRPIPGSFIRPPQQDSYDAPPLPPPPPGATSYSSGYDEPPPPPDYGYNNDYNDYSYGNQGYDEYQEYDDSQYDDSAPPPPPPPM